MFLPCRLSDTSLSPFVLSLSALILLPPDWYTIENSIPGVSPLPFLEAAYVIGVDCPNMDVIIDNTNSQPVIRLTICFIILPVLSCFILKFSILQIYFFYIISKINLFKYAILSQKDPLSHFVLLLFYRIRHFFSIKEHIPFTFLSHLTILALKKRCKKMFFINFYFFLFLEKRFSFFCIFFRHLFVFSCLFFHFVLTKKACASITIRYAGYLSLIYYSIVL